MGPTIPIQAMDSAAFLAAHPFDIDPLIGRDRDVDAVVGLSARHRIVTLTGPGGSGKTRLARAALGQTADGIFVDLVAATNTDQTIQLIGDAMEITESRELPLRVAIERWLDQRPFLLVLDNLEQIADASSLIGGLLDAATGLRVMATSRVPLGRAGEVEYVVRPLGLPVDDTVAGVEASPAGALFLARARAVGRLHDLDAPTARDVARLCRRLDGLPLAIELAASRTRILSPSAILARLDAHDPNLLSRASGDDRHRSLTDVLDWSIQLLAPAERDLLFATSVCVAGFDLPMAEALARSGTDVFGALDTLAAYGLVSVSESFQGESRFRQLEPIRLTAWERLGDGQEATARRHAEQLARDLAVRVEAIDEPDAMAALARLDADRPNLDAALEWADTADPALGLRLAALAYPYWAVRGQMRAAIARLERSLELAGDPPSAMSARAMGGLSRLTYLRLGHEPSRAVSDAAARLGRETGDAEAEIEGLQGIVFSILVGVGAEDDVVRAARDRATELIVEANGPAQRARARQIILVASLIEHGHQSDDLLTELGAAIADTREAGNDLGLAKLLGNRAVTHAARAEYREAIDDALDAAGLFRRFGDVTNEALFTKTAAISLAGIGDGAGSRRGFSEAYELAAPGESRYLISEVLSSAAAASALLGDPVEAGRLWGAAEHAIAPEIARPTEVAEILDRARRTAGEVAWQVAVAEGRATEPAEALRRFLEAGPVVRARGDSEIRLRHGQLTRREVEILRLLATGKTDGEIALTLFISPKTASVHVSNVKAKLGVETRLDAALAARAMGLANPDQPPDRPPTGPTKTGSG